MSEKRGSHLERAFARKSLTGFGLLVAVVVTAAAAWAAFWGGTSARIRSEVDTYTRQEALTLARTLLYDLAADRRLAAIQELEDLMEDLPKGDGAPDPDLLKVLAENPSLPDAVLWERVRRSGSKATLEELGVARRSLYAQSVARYAEEIEEDLWARVTLSDHLRAIQLRSRRGMVLWVGDAPAGVFSGAGGAAGQVKEEAGGFIAVRLPLYIGLTKWGEVWCLMDRSPVLGVADRIRASMRSGQALLAGIGAILLMALACIGYLFQRSLRADVVAPVVQLARRMESWEQEFPPEETGLSETQWLSEAFDRLLDRVRSLLAERDAALDRVQSQQEALLKAERLGLLERM
jgi:hypothetical protein